MNLDARLRRALQPVDPPDEFARRVRRRIALQASPGAAHVTTPAAGWRSWLATAAAAVGIALGTYGYQHYEDRREALAARAQVLLALQIASRELNTAQRAIVRPTDASRDDAQDAPAGDQR